MEVLRVRWWDEMKSRARTAVILADFGNGCLQDSQLRVHRYQHMHSEEQSSATRYLKSGPTRPIKSLVMHVCRRNVVRGLYLWDVEYQRFPPFLQNVCILRVCMYVHPRVFDFEHAIYFI